MFCLLTVMLALLPIGLPATAGIIRPSKETPKYARHYTHHNRERGQRGANDNEDAPIRIRFLPDPGAINMYSIDVTYPDGEPAHDFYDTSAGPVAGVCPLREFLRILAQRIKQFHKERPNARISDMDFEANMIRELWLHLLLSVREAELKLNQIMVPTPEGNTQIPPASAIDAAEHATVFSTTNRAIVRLFHEYGMRVTEFGCTDFPFKESLHGERWSQIARRPDGGISFAPQVQVVLDGARIKIPGGR
jgi:hypothetical protein